MPFTWEMSERTPVLVSRTNPVANRLLACAPELKIGKRVAAGIVIGIGLAGRAAKIEDSVGTDAGESTPARCLNVRIC